MSVGGFFTRRVRDRRAALRAMRRDHPHAFVTLVLGYPLVPVVDADSAAPDGPGRFPDADLLVAGPDGVSVWALDRRTSRWSAPWEQLPPITVEVADGSTPLLRVGDRRYFGMLTTGAFALPADQLRRLAAKLEERRPDEG